MYISMYMLAIWQLHIGEGLFLCCSAIVYNIPAAGIRRRDKAGWDWVEALSLGAEAALTGAVHYSHAVTPCTECVSPPQSCWDCLILFLNTFWPKRRWEGLSRKGPINDKQTFKISLLAWLQTSERTPSTPPTPSLSCCCHWCWVSVSPHCLLVL